MIQTTKRQQAAFILPLILCLSGVLSFFSLQEGHDWGGDFALYLRQAQSILDGSSDELLSFNSYAMEQSTQQEGASPQLGPHLYPWGFPLLLAPIVAAVGFSLSTIKLYMVLFFVLSLWVCYRLFLPRLGDTYSLWLTALLGFNPFLLQFVNTINSDIPFLFFALLSILFIEKSLGNRKVFVNKTITLLLTGLLIYFSFLVRTNGIVLLGVLGIGHLIKWYQPLKDRFLITLRNEWKELLPYMVFLACAILLKFWLPEGSGSHLEFLKRLTPGKLLYNLMYYVELPAEFFSGVVFPNLIYGFTLPFLLLGIYKSYRRMPDILYLVYSTGSLIVFILWPPIQGLRFIFTLLPFYIYFVFIGISSAEIVVNPEIRRIHFRWVPAFSMIIFFLFLSRSVSFAWEVNEHFPERKVSEGPYSAESREMFDYLDSHVPADATVIFWKPRVLSFLSGRQSLRVTKLEELESGKGDFLIFNKWVDFGQISHEEFQQLQQKYPPLFENQQYVVIELDALSPSLPASR